MGNTEAIKNLEIQIKECDDICENCNHFEEDCYDCSIRGDLDALHYELYQELNIDFNFKGIRL